MLLCPIVIFVERGGLAGQRIYQVSRQTDVDSWEGGRHHGSLWQTSSKSLTCPGRESR